MNKKTKKKVILFLSLDLILFCIAILFCYWQVYGAASENSFRSWIVKNIPLSVASVNGKGVPLRDFETKVADSNYFLEQQKVYNLSLVEGAQPENIETYVLDRMIDLALLEEIAKEYDVSVSDDDVRAYYDDFIVPQDAQGGVGIARDLELYYGWTPEEFMEHELYPVVLKIAVTKALRMDEKNNKSALEEAEKIRADIEKNTAKPFSDFAKEFSADAATAESGGMIGFIARGQYDPEFEEAVFALEIGEVSDPIRSDIGYHIVKLTNRDDDADTREIRHILIKTPSVDDLLAEKKESAKIKKRIPRLFE